MTTDTNSTFYYEVCLLRLLAKMGYFTEQEYQDIVKIAVKDYGTGFVVDSTLLCLN